MKWARDLNASERSVLTSLVSETGRAKSRLNARTFRRTHRATLDSVDQLEQDGFILRERDEYWPSLMALVQLDDPAAIAALESCAQLLPALHDWYVDHETKPLSVAVAAGIAGLSEQATLQALRFLFESPGWCAGRSSDWLDDPAPTVCVDEGVLRLPELADRLQQLSEWQRRKITGDGYPYGIGTAQTRPRVHRDNELVALPPDTGERMARIFFSYSHDDEQYRDQLEKHLAALKHEGLIDSWHDRRILAGSSVDKEIDNNLERADVILLLVSASFIASRYCYGVEMRRALERQGRGLARVIPVIVRPCDWQHPPLSGLLAAPRDGKPITTWSNYDEAYADVARQIRAVVEQEFGTPDVAVAAEPTRQAKLTTHAPRSSNLRLRREFTDADKDAFLHTSFDFIAQFFEGSVQELQRRHADIECRYRRVDANTFTASIFRGGKKEAECAVVLGGVFRDGAITYSKDASSRGNSFNESLSVGHDEQTLFFRPLGMSFRGTHQEKLSCEQAAEYYWEMLIAPLQ